MMPISPVCVISRVALIALTLADLALIVVQSGSEIWQRCPLLMAIYNKMKILIIKIVNRDLR
jgi:type III secretory pathway component EscT